MKRRALLSTLAAVAATASLGWLWQHKRGSGADRHDIVQTVFASPLPPLTPWHLQLIRKLRVTWVPIESGAPGIDPLQPLRGELYSLEIAQQILADSQPGPGHPAADRSQPLDSGICRMQTCTFINARLSS